MQSRGAVDRGDSVFRARPLCHHLLEAVNVTADGRDPVRVETFLDVLPLVPANLGHDQGHKIRGRQCARSQLFRWIQFRYLPSSKLPIMLLLHKVRHFLDALGDCAGDLESELVGDAGERHTVVPRIFGPCARTR